MTPRNRTSCSPVNVTRSRTMASIRSRGNGTTEMALVRLFRIKNVTGWRRHLPLPGRPDFIFKHARLAVFVDGCFWHGCRWCYQAPKQNSSYWSQKVRANKLRDVEVSRVLRNQGWRVCRIWEHSLTDAEKVAAKIRRLLAEQEQ